MNDNDSHYRREEDKKWRDKVDRSIVTLMTSQRVINEWLKRLERTVNDLDHAVRGDAKEDRSGLLARLHEQETYIARLNAVVFRDAAGNGGLVDIARNLKDKDERIERRFEKRWTVYGSIAVATITSTALVLTNWPRVREFVLDTIAAVEHTTKKVEKPIKRSKIGLRRNGTKRKPPPVVKPPETEESESEGHDAE